MNDDEKKAMCKEYLCKKMFDDDNQRRVARILADVLQLKVDVNGMVETAYGRKSEIGLYLTVLSIMHEEG